MDNYITREIRYVFVCTPDIYVFVGRLKDVFCRAGNIFTPGITRKDGEMMIKASNTDKPTDGKSFIIREIFRYVFCRTGKSFITEISRVDGEVVKINNTGKPSDGKSCMIGEIFRKAVEEVKINIHLFALGPGDGLLISEEIQHYMQVKVGK